MRVPSYLHDANRQTVLEGAVATVQPTSGQIAAIRIFQHLPRVLFWRKDWDWLRAAIIASVDEAVKREREGAERNGTPTGRSV